MDYSIYLVTDDHYLAGRDFYTCLEQALLGGVTVVQLREKELEQQAFLERAWLVQRLCARYQVPLLINDEVEIAAEVGAAGVHLGQEDASLLQARACLGQKAIIGISAHTVDEARLAEEQGADYIGVGAVFPTGSKQVANELGLAGLRTICAAVSIPAVAIGGLTLERYPLARAQGAAGCAMISAIYQAEDIKQRVLDIKKISGR